MAYDNSSPSKSYKVSLQSIFHVHNETANIWSHLLGALLFISQLLKLIAHPWSSLANLPNSDVLAITVYHLAVINCFTVSTIFHIFSNHSESIHKFWNELDYLGIVLVIYGSTVPATYFQFYYDPFKRNVHWALSTIFTAASTVFTLRREFRQPKYRRTRFYMYSLLGLSCFIPVMYGIFTVGYQTLDDRMSVTDFFSLAAIQFSGAAVYTARLPERVFPNYFDIVGNSHQVMHVAVIVGAKVFEEGLFRAAARWSDGFNSCSA